MISLLKYERNFGMVIHQDKKIKGMDYSYHIFNNFHEDPRNRVIHDYKNTFLFIQDKCSYFDLHGLYPATFTNVSFQWWPNRKEYIKVYIEILEHDLLRKDIVPIREQLITLLLLELSQLKRFL